jgi:hypothetical protein
VGLGQTSRLTAIDSERVFHVDDCCACRIGKMNCLNISLGSGVRPNPLGWLSSDFVPVTPKARGGFLGWYHTTYREFGVGPFVYLVRLVVYLNWE